MARVIGLPHVLAEALALTGLAGGALGLTLAAGSYRSGSRVARTRPELVTTWCDGNPGLADALDDAIARLVAARDALAEHGTVLPLAAAGHAARMNWEHRTLPAGRGAGRGRGACSSTDAAADGSPPCCRTPTVPACWACDRARSDTARTRSPAVDRPPGCAGGGPRPLCWVSSSTGLA